MIPKAVAMHRMRTNGLEPFVVAEAGKGVPLISRDTLSNTIPNTSPYHNNYAALHGISVEADN